MLLCQSCKYFGENSPIMVVYNAGREQVPASRLMIRGMRQLTRSRRFITAKMNSALTRQTAMSTVQMLHSCMPLSHR